MNISVVCWKNAKSVTSYQVNCLCHDSVKILMDPLFLCCCFFFVFYLYLLWFAIETSTLFLSINQLNGKIGRCKTAHKNCLFSSETHKPTRQHTHTRKIKKNRSQRIYSEKTVIFIRYTPIFTFYPLEYKRFNLVFFS